MACEVIWAPSARLDLAELASYIGASRPKASAHFISQVFQTVEHLGDVLIRGSGAVASIASCV